MTANLAAALRQARETICALVSAYVGIESIPAEHVIVKLIDAALAEHEAMRSDYDELVKLLRVGYCPSWRVQEAADAIEQQGREIAILRAANEAIHQQNEMFRSDIERVTGRGTGYLGDDCMSG